MIQKVSAVQHKRERNEMEFVVCLPHEVERRIVFNCEFQLEINERLNILFKENL